MTIRPGLSIYWFLIAGHVKEETKRPAYLCNLCHLCHIEIPENKLSLSLSLTYNFNSLQFSGMYEKSAAKRSRNELFRLLSDFVLQPIKFKLTINSDNYLDTFPTSFRLCFASLSISSNNEVGKVFGFRSSSNFILHSVLDSDFFLQVVHSEFNWNSRLLYEFSLQSLVVISIKLDRWGLFNLHFVLLFNIDIHCYNYDMQLKFIY